MTEQPTVHQPAASTWPSRTAWAAYSACALALALVRPWGRRVPRRLLGGVAWAASVVLTLYGGLLVAVGASVLAGVIRPAGPVDRTALRWHVLLWDLWFLVWGLLLGVAAWHHGRQSRPQNFCPPA